MDFIGASHSIHSNTMRQRTFKMFASVVTYIMSPNKVTECRPPSLLTVGLFQNPSPVR